MGRHPLDWLQETFEQVNNGRHPEFTLPKRIELVVPETVLGEETLAVTLIDTQGIDDVAERADIEQHFDDAHTVVILCNLFNYWREPKRLVCVLWKATSGYWSCRDQVMH
jgi:hypothetical protein